MRSDELRELYAMVEDQPSPRHGGSRLRWWQACVLAEAVGIGAAATAMRLSDGWSTPAAVLAVTTGGAVEGLALGVLQGAVLHDRVPALRRGLFAVATLLVAAAAWSGSAVMTVGADDSTAAQPPLVLVLAGAAGIGLAMGLLLGGAQALVLQASAFGSLRYWLTTAVGWALAMPVGYAGAALVPASTTTLQVSGVGVATGAAAGLVLGLVTTPAVRRLHRRVTHPAHPVAPAGPDRATWRVP